MELNLKLGTRKSLLAWAQSSYIARELTRVHAERGQKLNVQLVGIETQGDKILDKPLSQIEGKEFFTAELDHALLRGDVDFTVHSMKDLALERPAALTLGAIPARELSHDVAIFHESVLERLKKGEAIRVGTSSPRRLTLVPPFLRQALPRFSAATEPRLEMREIRGNVNTRLSRIHEPEGSEKKLDAVILAFAGLERLAIDPQARIELSRLMQNTRVMVLPLRENPTAPAQGALAIECRTDQKNVITLLQALHDETTAQNVGQERAILSEWGGGCHQKLGASWFSSPIANQGHLYIKGQKPNGESVSEARGKTLSQVPSHFLKVETSELFDFIPTAPRANEKQVFESSNAAFIAHHRAYDFLPADMKSALATKRVWVSGAQSWFKLAQAGVWVEGSTDSLGIKSLEAFVSKNFLNILKPLKNWSFLSHLESTSMEPHFSFSIAVVPTYSHQFKSIPTAVKNATHLYWSSGLAFTETMNHLSSSEKESFLKKTHACGPGRTLQVLKNHGLTPEVILKE